MSVIVDELLTPIAPDLIEFERRLEDSVKADFGPMADAMEHIVRAGGKRLRPALVLLSAALGTPDRDHAFNLAMGIEFIHTATLVHDDLIDNARTRRGITTIHETVGTNPAIIIGDYYFAKGANLLASIGEPSIDLAISNTVMTICMGELLQLTSRRDWDQTLEEYHRKIARKTASLVETCCYCGAVVGGLDEVRTEALRQYGYLIGMAFQIADDVLDYTSDAGTLGKNLGDDLAEGKATLPLIHAIGHSDAHVRDGLRAAIEHGDTSALPQVLAAIHASGGLEYSRERARGYADLAERALDGLDDNDYLAALRGLARYAVNRDH